MTRGMALALVVLAAAGTARAEDAPKRPWSDQAEVGIVATSGNSSGTNLAGSNTFKYAWSDAELTIDAKALRAESTTRTLSNPDGTVRVDETKAVTAENYFLAGKYRMTIRDGFYWYAGASWYRNVFAGLDARILAGGGVGYQFVKTARHLLKGELGADYTREDPVGDPPPAELETQDFGAFRGYLGYEFKIAEKSKLTEDLSVFDRLDETSAWRATSTTAVVAGLTDELALKFGYTVLYDNEPQFTVVPPDAGAPAGTPSALYRFKKTDTILSATLVLNF